MADEEIEELKKALNETQGDFGVDIEMLRYNRSLSIEDRIEKHRKAAESVLLLKDVARRARYRQTG